MFKYILNKYRAPNFTYVNSVKTLLLQLLHKHNIIVALFTSSE